MKVRKSELRMMIKEMLLEVLNEQEETPAERKRRLRDKFKQQQQPASTSTDPNTPEGRENLVEMVSPAYGSVQTRLQIIQKMCVNAMQSDNRQEFKEYLIQMFDNLKSLQEKDMVSLVSAYSKVASLLGLGSSGPVTEQNMNPDTSEGRRNLMKDIYNSVSEMRKMAEEGRKMLATAETVPTVSVFRNEMKALGQQIGKLRSYLTNLNSAFVTTFKEYEAQRGRASVPPTPPRVPATPPPVPAAARKKTVA